LRRLTEAKSNLADCVEKGPHQLPQKRSLVLVSILQSLAAAEIANALHLRDFRSPVIFEFFNTIRGEADTPPQGRDFRFGPNCAINQRFMLQLRSRSAVPSGAFRFGNSATVRRGRNVFK
jgi:hypothetical protein